MKGFWGSFTSILDNKGRINFPAKLRKGLAEEDEDTLIIIRGSERCLSMYPLTAWQQLIEKIKEKVENDREFGIVSRRLMYQASEQKIDKQGRLNLPASLIEYAQLNGEVLIVGYENKVEVWNPQKYEEFVHSTEGDFLKVTRDLNI
ncbi:MAG: division/cell wall cluster transcriptional repressor MraZ [Calditrichaeota bacterium]|nr:MAG: division/cell wall cluster transcriptional repressor MraZ [Calditrichota bacterium]